MATEKPVYMAELRQDQWDLIVLALEHVRGLINTTNASTSVDHLGRKFLVRCCKEIIADIQAQVPKSDD